MSRELRHKEREERYASGHHNQGSRQLILGVLVIGMGVLFLLDNMGFWDFRHALQFWPVVFIAVGVLKLTSSRRPDGYILGAVLVGVGVLMILNRLGIIYFSWRLMWPVLLIALGAQPSRFQIGPRLPHLSMGGAFVGPGSGQRGAQVLLLEDCHPVHLVGGPETVEEVQERYPGLHRGQVGDNSQVLGLLHRAGGQHGEAGASCGHHVGVVTEDRGGVCGNRSGGDVDDRGGQLTGNLEHVGQHEQQTLG